MLSSPLAAVLAEVGPSLATHGRVALCQVVRAEGSTPGKEGWKLLLRPDGSGVGNLGGGAFEALVKVDAMARLGAASALPELKRYYLTEEAVRGEATGMVCGGMLEVFIEVLTDRPLLVICGGGPVGQALARAGELAGFELVLADDREAFRQPELFPVGTHLTALPRSLDAPAPSVATGPEAPALAAVFGASGSRDLFVAVVSRCWETDLAALGVILGDAPGSPPPGLRYLGVMGSRRKIARLRDELVARAYDLAALPLHAPIGLPIGGDTPGEIAIGVLAEVLAERHHRPLVAAPPLPPRPASP
jgi:xanthine dehydrogenase accessory factor